MDPIRRRALFALPLALPAAVSAAAQTTPRRGPNGGQVVVVDGHPIEMVASGTTLTLYLNEEDGRPAPSARASGRATVQAGGRTATVDLSPAEPNRLVGALAAPLAAGARVVFNGAMGDGHRIAARYVME